MQIEPEQENPKFVELPTIWNIYESFDFSSVRISTGCQKIDEFLEGGIPRGKLIEITGIAGTGKSQLAMQICLHLIKSANLHQKIIYVTFKKQISLERLFQLKGKLKRIRIFKQI